LKQNKIILPEIDVLTSLKSISYSILNPLNIVEQTPEIYIHTTEKMDSKNQNPLYDLGI
jgi:hypothetical protein